jgi:transaldolase
VIICSAGVQFFNFVSDFPAAHADPLPKVSYIDNEPEFRWELLQEQMAFDKLHEGIKKFAEDGATLKALLRQKLSTA